MAPGRMNMSCAMLPSTFCLLLLAGPASAAFHSSSMVTLADGNPSRIDEVEEDVAILAANDDGSLTTDTVSLLSLAQPEPSDTFVSINASTGQVLTTTPDHRIPVGDACCSTLKKAKDVTVGEVVWVVAGNDTQGNAGPATVSDVEHTTAQGRHSPVLTHGRLPIVDGFVTCSFEDIEAVKIASHGLSYMLGACKRSATCHQLPTVRRLYPFWDGEHRYFDNVPVP